MKTIIKNDSELKNQIYFSHYLKNVNYREKNNDKIKNKYQMVG